MNKPEIIDELAKRMGCKKKDARLMIKCFQEQRSDNFMNKDLSFLSVKEVARLLNVTENTVRLWLKTGSLKGYKLGKSYRINYSDLLDYIKNRQNKGF